MLLMELLLWFNIQNNVRRDPSSSMQEDSTGMDTGMKDYLTVNHPELLDKLTPNSYDEIFVVPWATSRSALSIHHSTVD